MHRAESHQWPTNGIGRVRIEDRCDVVTIGGCSLYFVPNTEIQSQFGSRLPVVLHIPTEVMGGHRWIVSSPCRRRMCRLRLLSRTPSSNCATPFPVVNPVGLLGSGPLVKVPPESSVDWKKFA